MQEQNTPSTKNDKSQTSAGGPTGTTGQNASSTGSTGSAGTAPKVGGEIMANQSSQGSSTGGENKSQGMGGSTGSTGSAAGSTGAGAGTGAVADKAADAFEAAKSGSLDLLDKAKSTATDAMGSVTDKAAAKIDETKAGLTGGLTSVADSMRKVAGGLNDGKETSPVTEYSAKYAETAARKLEDVAKYFDAKDVKGIARDLESYARKNPAIFLGAAFALGIVAARFIKSSPNAAKSMGTGGQAKGGSANPANTGGDKMDRVANDPGMTSSSRGV